MNRVRANLFAFSGAKTYTQMKELRDFIFEGGKSKPWTEIRAKALEMNENYNLNWLQTEKDMVIRAGVMGSMWVDIQKDKDLYPYLMYQTANDSKVRKEHAAFNGIILRADDEFWLKYFPPNGWNCRCTVVQLTEAGFKAAGGKLSDSEQLQKDLAESTPEYFQRNYGISEIFPVDGHDYYSNVPNGKPTQLDAVANYGLRSWERINAKPLPELGYEKDSATFSERWLDLMAKNAPDGEDRFVLKHAETGCVALLDNALKERLAAKNTFLAGALQQLFEQPNEVWSHYTVGGSDSNTAYLSFYKGKALVAVVDKGGSVIDIREVTQVDSERKGVLLWRK